MTVPFLVPAVLLVLLGCSQTTYYFRNAPVTRIAVDGTVFDVRVRDDLAEAQRINSEYAPRLGPIAGRAAFAMEKVSGCRVDKVAGDAALVTGFLDCGGRRRDWVPLAEPRSFSFLELTQWQSDAASQLYFDYDCDPY